MTITVTPTVEASNVPPRVRLDVTADASETATTVTRLDADGHLRPVRTNDGGPLGISGGVALVYDYEAPFETSVSYSSEESPATVSATVTVPETRVWLIHPGVPELSTPIVIASFGSRRRRVTQGVFFPLARSKPLVFTDGARKAPESVLEVRTDSEGDLLAIDAITEDASTLLLNIPASLGWGIPTSYIAIGDTDEDRLVDYAAEPRRYVTLPYFVVDRPAGGSQAERTWADVIVDYATWDDVMAAYDTWLDLLVGP